MDLLLANTVPRSHRKGLEGVLVVAAEADVAHPSLGDELVRLGEIGRGLVGSPVVDVDDGLYS